LRKKDGATTPLAQISRWCSYIIRFHWRNQQATLWQWLIRTIGPKSFCYITMLQWTVCSVPQSID